MCNKIVYKYLCFLGVSVFLQTAVAVPGDNIALGKAYTLTPTPNYDHPSPDITNQINDDIDLTDGIFVQALHTYNESVTWQYPSAQIVMDLDAPLCQSDGSGCKAISEINFHVHGNHHSSGIYCPEGALFEVSDNGQDFYAVSRWTRPEGYPEEYCGLPGPDFDSKQWNFIVSSGALETRGAFVRLTIYGSGSFIFIDEMQVLEGGDTSLTNYLYDVELDTLGTDWRVIQSEPLAIVNQRSLPSIDSINLQRINLKLAKSETGTFSFLITNPYYEDIEISSQLSDLVNSSGLIISSTNISIRQGIDTQSNDFTTRADALVSLSTQAAKIIQRTVGHINIDITVPENTEPGIYKGDLRLNCKFGCTQNKIIPVELEVLPFYLTAKNNLPVSFFDWSYAIPEGSGFIEGALADERAEIRKFAGENTNISYLTPLPTWDSAGQLNPLDFTEFDRMLARYPNTRMHVLYLAGGSTPRLNFSYKACYPSTKWNETYTWWIQQITDHMLSKGFSYNKFALYIIDEPREGAPLNSSACGDPARNRLQLVQDASRLIRAINPQLQVWVNANERGTSMTLLNEIASEGLVDIWVPPYNAYFESQILRDFYQTRQVAGDEVWLYNGDVMSIASSSPHKNARLIPWTIWQNKIKGYGFWALYAPARLASGGASSVWDPFDGTTVDYSMIYLRDYSAPAGIPQDEAIIPSQRLMGWRQGIEDYRYLLYISDLILLRTSQGVDTSAYIGNLNQIVTNVLAAPNDLSQTAIARDIILNYIRDLSDKDNDSIINANDNCSLIYNPDQSNKDGDDFGDICDPDINNDLFVNNSDYVLFKESMLVANMAADFNNDGLVTAIDYSILRKYFGDAPGPAY